MLLPSKTESSTLSLDAMLDSSVPDNASAMSTAPVSSALTRFEDSGTAR